MARSKRKTPIRGITTAESEKKDKQLAHRKYRRKMKAVLQQVPDAEILPHVRELSGPRTSHELTGNGHDHLVGVFPAGHQPAIALAPPYLRLPTAVLDRLRQLFQPKWQVAADLGGISVGPSAFDEDTARMRMAGCGLQILTCACSSCSSRWRRAVCSLTEWTYAWKTVY
jgi:hypothetical protein